MFLNRLDVFSTTKIENSTDSQKIKRYIAVHVELTRIQLKRMHSANSVYSVLQRPKPITWKRAESIRQHAGWRKAVARILTGLWFVTVSANGFTERYSLIAIVIQVIHDTFDEKDS